MVKNDVYRALAPIIKRVTRIPTVILADQNSPAPKGSYCALQIATHMKQYAQSIERSKVTNHQTISTDYYRQMEVDCTLNFYRDGAIDYATRMVEFNKLMSVHDELRRHKLGVNYVGTVHNLTELFNANTEERASIKIILWYSVPITDEVNTIERVGVIVEDEEAKVLVDLDVDL